MLTDGRRKLVYLITMRTDFRRKVTYGNAEIGRFRIGHIIAYAVGLAGVLLVTRRSISYNSESGAEEGFRTTTVFSNEISDLSHCIALCVTLDIDFVSSVLSTTGPHTETSSQRSRWDWADWQFDIPKNADAESAYYPWLQWAVYAQAAATVRDKLYERAGQAVPLSRQGTSRIQVVYSNRYGSTPGVTDLIHDLKREKQFDDEDEGRRSIPCTLHQVKRARVLAVDGVNVLDDLVTWAGRDGGFKFREKAGRSQEKTRFLLLQAIDELVEYDVTHIVLSTQSHYVLLRLSPAYQLLVSRVYKINGSTTQLQDITDLVLFYAHAIVNPGVPYSQQPPGSITSANLVSALSINIPTFPASLFQPHLAFFRRGRRLTHRATLFPVKGSTTTLFRFPALPLRFHGDGALNRADADVAILFGRLVFWKIVGARVGAKTATSPQAGKRLVREFKVYNVMHALQGSAIPTLVGLYNDNNGNAVLVVSDVGAPVDTFKALSLIQRRTLLSHLVSLHRTGIYHNDFEPRNVMLSPSSSPVIIDFDDARLDHVCKGTSGGRMQDSRDIISYPLPQVLKIGLAVLDERVEDDSL
ncbi:hypothetical protein C8R45DRAFT_1150850 [Mycena sanguinolenta]|nr:hypothetical protein C8R45DRAFT_1150850 [Mycena sanguinolenta]